MTDILNCRRDDNVTTLTLNRPDKRNALSADLVENLLHGLNEAAGDGTRLLVLRGEGKAFCAGFDFSGIEDCTEGDLVLRFIRLEQLLQAIYHAPFATLVLAHGACYGAGADIVCSASRRVATPDARFRMPGLNFGIALGTRRLAEVTGADQARKLLETSPVFNADEAMASGFVSEIVAPVSWPAIIARASQDAGKLPAGDAARLHQLTRPDHRDEDLASLVRSAAEPGLKSRIKAFLAAPAA